MKLYDLDTPALIVDLSKLETNIQTTQSIVRANGNHFRPHTKTHKTPQIAKMQIDGGARGITVAKLGEAEVMAAAGLDDIFIANQIVGESKVARLIFLQKKAQVMVAVDSVEVAKPIADAALSADVCVPVTDEIKVRDIFAKFIFEKGFFCFKINRWQICVRLFVVRFFTF